MTIFISLLTERRGFLDSWLGFLTLILDRETVSNSAVGLAIIVIHPHGLTKKLDDKNFT